MIDTWSKMVIRHRVIVILLSVLILIGFSIGIKNIYFESSTDIWFLNNDPVLKRYNTLKERFGSDDYLIIGVEAAPNQKDVLNKETMTMIQKITTFLEEHAAVDKVRSLTKFEYIHYQDDVLHVDDVVPEDAENFDLTPEQWAKMRAILKKEKLAHGLLFTEDLKNTLISARVLPASEYTAGDDPKVDLASEFQAFAEQEGFADKDANLYISGSAAISESFFRVSIMDQSISYPLMVTLILIVLYIIFRTWVGTLLPFGIMLMATAICLGVIGYLGWAMNMLNVVIPTVLTVVALGGAIHILMGFYEFRNQGCSSQDSASLSLKKYFKPCFYASFTTSMGFLALTSSKLAPVVELGYVMVVGIMMAFVFTVSLLPAILSYTKTETSKVARLADTGIVARAIRSWPDWVYAYRKPILLFSVIMLVPVVYFSSKVVVDTNFVRNFKEDTSIRHGLEYFDNTYKGALSLEFMLDSGKKDGVKDPAFMQRALDFQNYVASLEGTGKANSMINYMMKINQVMHDDDPAYFRVPQSRDMVGQYLLLYSSSSPDEDLTDLMTYYGRYMRISVLFEVAPSNTTKERVQQIQRYINGHFSDLDIEISGRAVLFNNMDNYVLEGLTSSFSIALVVIAFCLFFLLGSLKYGLFALVPNIIPILVAGAVMGLFGIYLDFATLVVAAATLGIAVDDSIHFMIQYVNARREGRGHRESVGHAIANSGRAIVSTSIILVIGFSMLTISSFVPNILMGILGCVVIVFALIADLVLLPAVVMTVKQSGKVKNNSAVDEKIRYNPATSEE